MKTERRKLWVKALALSLSLMLVLTMFVATNIVSSGVAIPTWQPNVDYTKDAIVSFNGKYYQCVASHKSMDGWDPASVPALWKVYTGPITIEPTPTPTIGLKSPTPTIPSGGNSITISGYVKPDVNSTNPEIFAGFTVKVFGLESVSPVPNPYAVTNNSGYFEIKGVRKDYTGDVYLEISKTNFLTRKISKLTLSGDVAVGSQSKPVQIWAGDITVKGVQDNAINMSDIVELLSYFNSAAGDEKYNADFDFDKDKAINMTDITIIIKNFNKTGADYPNDVAIVITTPLPSPTEATPKIPTPTPTNKIPPDNMNRVMCGYWETWDGIQVHPPVGHIALNDAHPGYNVINVAFPILLSDGTCVFEDNSAPTEDVPEPEEIAQAKAAGRKVLISIGGAAAGMDLTSRTVADKFVTTCIKVIEKYGFDGIDIDIETGLVAGPSWNQLSPSQENLIYIIKKILDHFGPNFMLTMAPETAYVTGGTVSYGGPWGAYLPVILAVKDRLNWLQMQYYNGSMYGKDGTGYEAGSVDGIVKQTEAMIDGFKIRGTDVTFSLPAEKVVIGLPSSPGAGGGYAPPSTVQTALNILYAKYPKMRGLMTWSINWDASKGYEFVKNHRPYLDKLGSIK
ncbi:MAG: glycosyl hydrolase family 18 protein [Clostridia bacterium]|nr:glycosyl hydrolase family 18 protein [Clostridia bacterium]